MKVAFSQASESIGMALLPAVEALLPIVIKFADWASQNTEIVIALAAAIGGLSAAIVVANFAMKAWAAAQAIATAAQWAFNAALTANPIGIVVVAVAALVAGLVLLYRRFETVRNIVKALLAPLKAAADGLGWLARKLGIVGDEIKENFTPSVDEARKQAGDMYASVREVSGGLEDLEDTADAAAGAQEDLARSVNAVYDNVKKLNPELVEMLRLLDVQDDIEKLRTEFDNYNEVIAESSDNVRELQQAERDLTRAIIETLSAHGLLTLAFDKQLKIKIDTGDLDAAYASALRVLNAFQQVQQVSAGQRPSTYVPTRDELRFLGAEPVSTTTITPIASITRAPSGAIQNVTVNVSTINPTQEVGEAVVTAIRNYNRTSGSAAIGVSRL